MLFSSLFKTVPRASILKYYIYFSCVAVLMLALIVLTGWHLGLTTMVQGRSGVVPMQYNTALALGLCALSLFSFNASGWSRRLGMAAASLALILATVTGLQYLTGYDFKIDNIFIDPYMGEQFQLQVKTAYPGRMAPLSVLCFIVLSAACLCWHLMERMDARQNILFVLAALVVTLSATALIGYIFGIEAAYGWWSLSDIAPQTAAGFFLLGTGAMTLVFARPAGAGLLETGRTARKTFITIVAGLLVTMAIVQGVLEQGQKRASDLVEAEAARIADVTARDIRAGTAPLERMQARWKVQNGISREDWHLNADLFIEYNAAYSALALVDRGFKIYESVSRSQKEDFWEGVQLNPSVLTASAESDKPLAVRVVRNGQELPELMFILPLRSQGGLDGFLAVAYSLHDGIARQLDVREQDFHFVISDDLGDLARNFAEIHNSWEVSHTETIHVYGRALKISVAKDVSGFGNGGLLFLIFIAGVGMSLLLAGNMQKTDLIRANAEKLAESDERYTMATEGARLALLDWDAKEGRVAWAGEAWRFFGVDNNDKVPSDVSAVRARMPEEDRKVIDETILNTLSTADNYTAEFRIQQPDGRILWVQSRGKAALRRDGHPVRVVGVLNDVTDLKEYEAQLKRTNEELEQFAYIASHDLKAPLRGIDSLAKWIDEDLPETVGGDIREKLKLMRGRVERLEILLEDILQYSRAGRIVDEPTEVDTGKIVATIAAALAMPEGFKVEIAPDMPTLMTAHTPMEQIFQNLIANAYKHHDRAEGVIKVSATEIGPFYEFCVADDGPGIPREFQGRVFKMFQTLQSRDRKEGSGLGLSIVKKLVEWQGGRVWIVSEDGKRGTEMHFLWPKRLRKVKKNEL